MFHQHVHSKFTKKIWFIGVGYRQHINNVVVQYVKEYLNHIRIHHLLSLRYVTENHLYTITMKIYL